MLYVLSLMSTFGGEPAADSYRVISVEHRSVFAGRLGYRVEQTLVAERDGHKYEIKLGRAHTAMRGSVREYGSGDQIGRLDWGDRVRRID
jgi:hypothetical protein